MRKPLPVWVLVVGLAYLSLGGLGGGFFMLSDPSGTSLGFPPETLAALPFSDFFLPGVFVFAVFGLLPLAEIFAIFSHRHWAGRLAFWLGAVLVVWMLVQFLYIGFTVPIQWVMLGIGLLLAVFSRLTSVRGYFQQAY